MKPQYKPAVCRDGFTMSIQASSFHYCSPREDDPAHGYTHVEIGFPSQEEPDLMKYAETPSTPTKTVYGWVPMETVKKVIAKHGGLISVTPLPAES